jgi:hypothetical protein
MIISLFVITVGIAPIIVSLVYGFREFYHDVGPSAWAIVGFDFFAGAATLYLGYRFFFKRGWEKLKLSL